MFDNPADNFENGSGEFEEIGGIPPVPARKPRQRMNKAVLIGGAAGLLLIAVLVFLLIPKKEVVRTIDPGLSAPTGTAELIAPGVRLLTNELLVKVKDGTSLADLERQLEELDGAVTGYMPALRQYQVRFNTSSREELDGKKDGAAGLEVAERVDYNLLIALETDEKPGNSAAFFTGDGEKIGILGVLPSQGSGSKPLFLPSADFGDRDAMAAAGLDDPAGREAAAALADGREVTYASAFYYTKAPDGSLSRCTTTAALRYQIAALAEAGAEVICIPGAAPAADDPLLEGEAAQTEALLKILAEKNGRFMICKAGKDLLTDMLTASETGRQHTLAVVSCAASAADPVDLSGSGRRLYHTGILPDEETVCVPGEDDIRAVLAAAAYAGEALKNETPENVIRIARTNGKAIAWDETGRVAAALDDHIPAGGGDIILQAGTRVITVYAEDEITRLPPDGATLQIGGFSGEKMPGGVRQILADGTADTFTVKADGYQDRNGDARDAADNVIHVGLKRSSGSATGNIKGKVLFPDGKTPAGLSVQITDPAGPVVWGAQPISPAYSVPAYPGTYDVTISAYDRTPVTIYGVIVKAGKDTAVDEVTLSVPSDIWGTVAGTIRDAKEALPNASLCFYEGIGSAAAGKKPFRTAVSKADGTYEIDLPGGMYTLTASLAGYSDGTVAVRSEGEIRLPDQDCALKKAVSFSDLQWEEYDNIKDHPVATDYPDEPKTHVKASGKNIEFHGYNISAMDAGVRIRLKPTEDFEIECDIDTSKIDAHPGGELEIKLGEVSLVVKKWAEYNEITWEEFPHETCEIKLAGRVVETMNSNFHLKMSLTQGGLYRVEVDRRGIINERIETKKDTVIQFGFKHDEHYCDRLSHVYVRNIGMTLTRWE